MKKYAIIVAGGEGTRIGGALPKQLQEINGFPMLWHTLRKFREEDGETTLIVVINSKVADIWKGMCENMADVDKISHNITFGGATRTESVKCGLALVPEDEDVLVAVHDAARPMVSVETIYSGWKEAEKSGAAVPVVAMTDSLRKLDGDGSHAVDRNCYVAVQTPQVFKASVLKAAYAKGGDASFSDDASAVEAYGHKVSLFPGNPSNIKVTNPVDLRIAEIMI